MKLWKNRFSNYLCTWGTKCYKCQLFGSMFLTTLFNIIPTTKSHIVCVYLYTGVYYSTVYSVLAQLISMRKQNLQANQSVWIRTCNLCITRTNVLPFLDHWAIAQWLETVRILCISSQVQDHHVVFLIINKIVLFHKVLLFDSVIISSTCIWLETFMQSQHLTTSWLQPSMPECTTRLRRQIRPSMAD